MITASQVIGFASRLEERSSELYLSLANELPDHADVLQSYSNACKKHAKQIERTYRGVISDALETGFAFDINEDDFPIQESMPNDKGEASTYQQVQDMEEFPMRFNREAARQSEALLADITKLFLLIAERRYNRLSELSGLTMAS